MSKLKTQHTQWDFNKLVPADDREEYLQGLRKDVEQAAQAFISKWKQRTDWLEDVAALREALDEYEYFERKYGAYDVEIFYWELSHAREQNNADVKGRINIIEDKVSELASEIEFFEIRLSKIDLEKQKEFLQAAELEPYRHFLEMTFAEGSITLSEKEERILNFKSAPAYSDWLQMTSTFLAKEERYFTDDKGEKHLLTLPQLLGKLSSTKKSLRDQAGSSVSNICQIHGEVAEAELNAVLKNRKINDRLRNVDRPDAVRHLQDDVSSDVVDALRDVVTSNFDISREFYEFKAQLLGQEKLGYHERMASLGDVDKEYTYEEAVGLVHQTFANLDPELAAIFQKFVEEGHIDVYPSKGKRGGAFCAYQGVELPTYILLNHTGKLEDVITLAHESGHGINDELMKRQNALHFGTPLSTAEVASTFFEDFVTDEVAEDLSDEEQLTLNVSRLDNDVSTIIRQIACYEFEWELHKKFREQGFVSKKEINQMFIDAMSAYTGDAVEFQAGHEYWWVYWSHIRVYFYVYSYASGQLISKALQRKVRENPEFINKVKEFLSAGRSASPKDIFADLDIDITDASFWQSGLQETRDLLAETKSLVKKLGKI